MKLSFLIWFLIKLRVVKIEKITVKQQQHQFYKQKAKLQTKQQRDKEQLNKMIDQQQPRSAHQNSQTILSSSIASLSSNLSSLQFSPPPIASKLPLLSPSFLSRYRNSRLPISPSLISKPFFSFNHILTELLCGTQSDTSISMCEKCDRSKDYELCSFMLGLVEERYNWKEDVRFKTSYEFYHKKKIDVFLTDEQIEHRLVSRLTILGIALPQTHNLLLTRILKTYLKHTIYYNQHPSLTLQNDLYFWFLTGIYYHIGVPQYFNQLQSLPKDSVGVHEPMMFWMLDTLMKSLKECTQQKIINVAQMTLQYCQFFYQRETKCLVNFFIKKQFYGINLYDIILEWTNQAMMGYMGIQFIGFFIKSILKQGYQYIQKTIMSYFEKRVIKLDRDQIVNFHHFATGPQNLENLQYLNSITEELKKTKKEQILKVLLDSNEEWPGIFFSTNVYDLKK